MAARHHDKTEAPTQKRKKEARRDGKVARSPDIVSWLSILIATSLLPGMVSRTSEATRGLLAQVIDVARAPDPKVLPTIFGNTLSALVGILAPTLVAFAGIALVGNVAQVGLLLTTKPLKPKLSHLNPLKGLKRVFSVKGLWAALAATMRLTVIGVVVWVMIRGVAGGLATAPMRSASASISELGATALAMVRVIAFVAVMIALADYAIKKRDLRRELRMTKQEVRQEARESEGDPHVRARQRSLRMSASRNRMLQMVAESDVVITNPTHYAIAIQYRRDKGAPRVVARGADGLAARIREAAARADVACVESPPLARALYRVCRPGEEIPAELYQGVATVLAFLHRLGAQRKAFGSRLGLDVPDTWTPTDGPLERVPPRRRAARERAKAIAKVVQPRPQVGPRPADGMTGP